ncbi:MAG: hypothetical protein J2P49_03850 [Methylocapsa sp.]|nr:hypothetical protein [Methylocapsa sp.]
MRTVWLSLGAAALFLQPALAGRSPHSQRMNQNTINQTAGPETTYPQGAEGPQQQGPMAKGMPNEPQSMKEQSGTAASSQQRESLKHELHASLKQAGFTDIQIIPESLLIRAKDAHGNPVDMVATPHSFTAVEFGKQGPMMGRSAQEEPQFVTGPFNDVANADLTDTAVQSSDNKDAGTIKGIAVGENGGISYLVTTVSGRDIAVNPDAMTLTYDNAADSWKASVDATMNQIESAPKVKME